MGRKLVPFKVMVNLSNKIVGIEWHGKRWKLCSKPENEWIVSITKFLELWSLLSAKTRKNMNFPSPVEWLHSQAWLYSSCMVLGQSSTPADTTYSVPVETALNILGKVQDWLLRSPDPRATVPQWLELLEVWDSLTYLCGGARWILNS